MRITQHLHGRETADAGPADAPSQHALSEAGLELRRSDGHLAITAARPLGERAAAPDEELVAAIVRTESTGSRSAVLILGRSSVRPLVDGALPLPIVELGGLSEIHIPRSLGGELLLFDDRPQVLAGIFSGPEPEQCALCRRPLVAGDAVWHCPSCHSAFHEGPRADPNEPELLCGSYDALCSRCQEPWPDVDTGAPTEESNGD